MNLPTGHPSPCAWVEQQTQTSREVCKWFNSYVNFKKQLLIRLPSQMCSMWFHWEGIGAHCLNLTTEWFGLKPGLSTWAGRNRMTKICAHSLPHFLQDLCPGSLWGCTNLWDNWLRRTPCSSSCPIPWSLPSIMAPASNPGAEFCLSFAISWENRPVLVCTNPWN